MTQPPAADSAGRADAGLASRAFASLCLVSFLASLFSAPFASLLPVYVEADVGQVPLVTGYLRALMLSLGGAFAIVGGRLCDLFGLKPLLLVGLCGTVAAGLALQSANLWVLSAFVVLAGIAAGR